MNQEFNNENKTNRFIFSNDFYSQLDNASITNDENSNVIMPSINETENNNLTSSEDNTINNQMSQPLSDIGLNQNETVEPNISSEVTFNMPEFNSNTMEAPQEIPVINNDPSQNINIINTLEQTPVIQPEPTNEIQMPNVNNEVTFNMPEFNSNTMEAPQEMPVINNEPSQNINMMNTLEQTPVIQSEPTNEIQMPNIDNEVTFNMPEFNSNTMEVPQEIPVINSDPSQNINMMNTFEQNPVVQSEPTDEIQSPIINSEVALNIPSINIVEPAQDVEAKETINNSDETNDFDATPKINKELEQELMKLNVESQPKAPIIEQGKWFEETKEKPLYRAIRNNPTPMPNFKTSDDDYEEPIAININPQVAEINKLFKQPPVINIDELVKQEEAELLKKEAEYKKEMESKIPATKSDLLERLRKKETETGKISILARYGIDFCENDYVTNPAIGRDEEIKQLILILLTPEKSGILVGKPGIGKTAIVEGLAYRLQRNLVPDALKGYCIISVKTTSLLGTLPNGETRLQTLIDEIKDLDKIILFIDEIHMLMGATSESSLDFANMFKESLGRGSIKMIGATTNDEYERYVLRDKAFVRRFQRVDVEEPSREHTIEILMGTLPKIEKNTGVTLKYSEYIKTEIMGFIVDITTEYKRIYGIGSRYPDICLTLLSQAFSQAVFDNRKEVNIFDIRNAIENSKNIYPDVIRKELVNFDKKFEKIINEE